jgi:hypothetical protein
VSVVIFVVEVVEVVFAVEVAIASGVSFEWVCHLSGYGLYGEGYLRNGGGLLY